MTLQEIKKALKPLVVKDIGNALKKFESILNSDSTYYNDTILQQASYNGLKREKSQGIISEAFANQKQAQIRYAIVQMIDMLDNDDVDFDAAIKIFAVKDVPVPDNDNPEPPASGNAEIYISYAWGGESETIVDLIDGTLKTKGVSIIRDKSALGYKGSITEFMKDIGKGNKIIVVISEKYLKSENCMFELVQIHENKNFAQRIFPIILSDANIYKPIERIPYIKYWESEIEKLDEAIKSLDRGMDVLELNQELNNYGKIRSLFSNISFILKDMNALTPEIHQNQNFQTLYDQLTS